MSFLAPSLVSHTNLTGLKSLIKSKPMFASSTSFLSLASDRAVIDVTLHLKVATAEFPKVTSFETVAEDDVEFVPRITLVASSR